MPYSIGMRKYDGPHNGYVEYEDDKIYSGNGCAYNSADLPGLEVVVRSRGIPSWVHRIACIIFFAEYQRNDAARYTNNAVAKTANDRNYPQYEYCRGIWQAFFLPVIKNRWFPGMLIFHRLKNFVLRYFVNIKSQCDNCNC
jgi:hypothetical protein